MKLYLLGRENLKVYKLPSKIEESISISDTIDEDIEIQLIIEAVDGVWNLKSTDKISIIENNMVLPSVILKDYQYYFINIAGIDKNIVLYSLPTKDSNTYNLSLGNLSKITIGSSQTCEICYKDSFIEPTHAEIVKTQTENNLFTWNLKAVNETSRIYLNNNLVKSAVLQTGDIIFINGLKIIWMNDFLNINNPNGQVAVQTLTLYQKEIDNTNYQPISEVESDLTLYKENDYFNHMLRIVNENKMEEVVIDASPSAPEKEDMPFILTIGSSITMGASSLMMAYSVFYGLSTGTKTIMSALPQIVMCVAMIVGSLILPKLSAKYQKKMQIKREKLRKEKYTAYILEKQNQIMEIQKKQEQTLKDNNPSAAECYQMLNFSNKITNINFWSRQVSDDDFLTIRIGTGNCLANIKVQAPEKHFTVDEDELLNQVYDIAERAKYLHNIPITISLLENHITGIIMNSTHDKDYINSLILQIVSMHSAVDLKLVVLTNENNKEKWDYVKYLPHCWSDDKEKRFFATNKDEINEISSYLEEEYKNRKNKVKTNQTEETKAEEEEVVKKQSYKKHTPYYLVINDDYNLAKGSIIVDLLLKTAVNYGFTYLCIGNKIKDLPNKCDAFIEIVEKTGTIIKETETGKEITKFNNEYAMNLDMRKVSNKLANIPVMTKDGLSVLPNTLPFLEMLKVSKIEQLNILNRWQTNNPVVSLATQVGVHTNGDDFKLDLHEKFHGPHGLIAGMTGSGKSEFIITYILSMAINYHPYEVQFVLIDYKGGGLAGAFENKETGVKIPHLVGTITNLDTAEMNRTLVSIDSELKRRQRIFNEVRDRLGEGTIDIYKYQRLYREGAVEEPMAHLFIISDEFAELKSQQPEFMQQLISTARIGRSLGLHLILATQKPSGVVNDQIWSNSKFKVCLKVQDRSDSMEMLKRPEAASIKETGRFYLQVGYNDYFDIGQSGWSGAKYIPSDRIIKKVDDAINFVNNVGYPVKTIKDLVKENTETNYGEQLTNIVKYIYDLGEKEQIKTNKLWLDSLSSEIYLQNLKKKYNYKPTSYVITPVIGEYDNPSEQEQGILTLDLSNGGNTLIYGQTGSGKENLLSTIIWSMMAEHTPDEVNIYGIDCGAETLKMFYNIPHVGEIATIEDGDLVYDIFDMLNQEIERRKELFMDYAGSYKEYCANSGKKLPLIVTVINNYEIFVENFSKLSEAVQNLYRDGSKYGIMFIISAIATNAVRSRMVQNFPNKICLQLPNETDYRNMLGSPRGLYPSKIFGRGLIAMNDTAYEFQTALFAPRKDMTNIVREVSKQLNSAYTTRAKKIPVLPKVVTPDLLSTEYTLDKLPIGYSIDTKNETYYNFNIPYIPIITRGMNEDRMGFVNSVIDLLSKTNNTEMRIVDFVNAASEKENIICYKENFDNAIIEIHNEVLANKNTEKDYYYVLLGVGSLRKYLSPNGQAVLNHLFSVMSDITNVHFILVDTYDSYKNLQLEVWYQSNINPLYGIWLGDEVGNQLAINIPQLTMDDRKISFPCMAFAVENGNYTVLKHVIEKKEDDSNEE